MSETFQTYSTGCSTWNPILGPNQYPMKPVTLRVRSYDQTYVKSRALPSWKVARKRGFVVLPYSRGESEMRRDIIRTRHTHSSTTYGTLLVGEGDVVSTGYPEHVFETPNPIVSHSFDTSVINALKIEVQDALYSAEFDLSTNVAELRETIEMFTSIIHGLRSPLRRYKDLESIFRRKQPPFVSKQLLELHRTNYTKFVKAYEKAIERQKNRAHKRSMKGYLKDITGVLSDMWLTWRYGIQPLLYSYQDLEKALTDPISVEFTKRETRSSMVDLTIPLRPHTKIRSVRGQGTKVLTEVSREGYAKVTVGAIARFRYKSDDQSFKSRFGVNPFITAYELIPLSFVLDWFINIGSWLGSLQRPEAVVEVAGWISYRENSVTQEDFLSLTTGPYNISATDRLTEYNDAGVWSDRHNTFVREIWDPKKPLLPSLNIELNQKRCFDAVALLRSILVK